jgi:hypothetical protein
MSEIHCAQFCNLQEQSLSQTLQSSHVVLILIGGDHGFGRGHRAGSGLLRGERHASYEARPLQKGFQESSRSDSNRNRKKFSRRIHSGIPFPDYVSSTSFRRRYHRGDFAFALSHRSGRRAAWRTDPSTVDYSHYLPILFEGLCEEKENLSTLASAALEDMLSAPGAGDKIVAAVPLLVMPITRGCT